MNFAADQKVTVSVIDSAGGLNIEHKKGIKSEAPWQPTIRKTGVSNSCGISREPFGVSLRAVLPLS